MAKAMAAQAEEEPAQLGEIRADLLQYEHEKREPSDLFLRHAIQGKSHYACFLKMPWPLRPHFGCIRRAILDIVSREKRADAIMRGATTLDEFLDEEESTNNYDVGLRRYTAWITPPPRKRPKNARKTGGGPKKADRPPPPPPPPPNQLSEGARVNLFYGDNLESSVQRFRRLL
jgi:hypothetical protein